MKIFTLPANLLYGLFLVFVVSACGLYPKTDFRTVYYDELDLLKVKSSKDTVYLKAHDYDGSVYIFHHQWSLDTITHVISGKGKHFSAHRKLVHAGELTISTDNIVLFETNKPLTGGAMALLGPKLLISVGNALLAGICLSVPKACFGSCPTFYVENTDNVFETRAEAFSSAISAGMEYNDIDDMQHVADGCSIFSLFMKNEALETHLVNHAKLLAFPVTDKNGYVLHATNDSFYRVLKEKAAENISGQSAPEAEILRQRDEKEWTSLADPNKLVTKEEWVMEFEPEDILIGENAGLKLTFRQTLMTTYLLYHAISYMGDEYSDYLAKMETSDRTGKKISRSFLKALGDIEVYTKGSNDNWVFQGSFYETGPIAKNTQLCIFKHKNFISANGKIHVKLVYNKGLWRFDEAALVRLSSPVNPHYLTPELVTKDNLLDKASLQILADPEKHLISMPGDNFSLQYHLPCEAREYQLFLDSRGYYLEWMRSNWLADKNIKKLHSMLKNPTGWLNSETKRYKLYEQQMETDFIESRIHNENKKLLKTLTAGIE